MEFTEGQIQILMNALSAAVGAGGSMGVQWLARKKTKEESADNHTETIIKASADTVKATQEVVTMLKSMLDEQKEQLTEKIDRMNSYFNEEIDNLNKNLKIVTKDNQTLTNRIADLTTENKTLKNDIKHLADNNKTLTDTVRVLKTRLSKYEKISGENKHGEETKNA